MWRKCRKEDGRYATFNLEKIENSIKMASEAVGKNGIDMDAVTDEVLSVLETVIKHKIPSTDEIGLAVEKALMHMNYDDIARAFILYRDNRRNIREGKSSLMEAVSKIVAEAQKDNANTPPSFPSKVLQIAEVALSQYDLHRVIDKDIATEHQLGAIHIHDLFGYGLAPNCLSIPVKKMLLNGFNTGTGGIRPPKRASSIFALAAIIFQSNQNEMVGGQMFAHFDYDMAEVMRQNCKEEPTESEIYQAVEGFVYNLNTMASLPEYEKIWVYDKNTSRMELFPIGDFYKLFEADRYEAISLNRETGYAELKTITGAYKHKNVHKVLRIKGKDGRKVFVTDNHSLMGISPSNDTVFQEVTGDAAKQVLEVGSDFVTTVQGNPLSTDMARFIGYYVAEGWGNGSTIGLSLFDDTLEKDVINIINGINPEWSVRTFGSVTKRGTISRTKNTMCNVNTGFVTYMEESCGKGAGNKRIPESILFGPYSVVKAFLDGYISGDGTVSNKISMSTISYELACGLLILFARLGMKASLKTVPAGKRWNAFPNAKEIYIISLTSCDSRKLHVTHMEKQKKLNALREAGAFHKSRSKSFHYSGVSDEVFSLLRLSNNICDYYNMSEDDLTEAIEEMGKRLREYATYERWIQKLKAIRNVFPVDVKGKETEADEEFVYDISVEANETFLTAEGIFVHNSRYGAQRVFSTVLVGTDTSPLGRLVTYYLLQVMQDGMDGSTFIWPNVIYRLKDGVNLKKGDPNYDLTLMAYQTCALRMNPTFMFMDASFNKPYGEEATYMGCRTRVIANCNGEEVIDGRGNIAFTTINLVHAALEAKGNIDKFYKIMGERTSLVERQLMHRMELTSALKKQDFPFLFGEHLYIGSEDLKPDDAIKPSLAQGTLTFGFCGLEECVKMLTGKYMWEDTEAHKLGYNIIQELSQCAFYAGERSFIEGNPMNFSIIASPAESASSRFARLDRRLFGEIEGVTDKDYYTNSHHICVDADVTPLQKIELEAPFHEVCSGGHICHVFLKSSPVGNTEAMERIINHALKNNIGYLAINFPINECRSCGNTDPSNETKCMKCGSTDLRKVRRITGYLAPLESWGQGKLSELSRRKDK